MNKRWRLLPILICFFGRSWSQQTPGTFTLNGTINARDSGTIVLMNINTVDYYPSYHGPKETLVVNGQFSITDSAPYPEAYMLGLKYDSGWQYLSSYFFIEPGINTIRCDSNHMWEMPAISNHTMDEWRNDFRGSRTLLSYTQSHPASYVGLWALVGNFTKGYEPLYDSIYKAFSPTIRNTYTGRMLDQMLNTARASCIGCRFPNLSLASIDNLSRKVSILKTYPKYTLIDVWYSHCGACIAQFPQFKKLYTRFRSAGFELIGISTDDDKKGIALWKEIISENKLPWPQFLDDHQIMLKQFGLNGWPNNYLLDKNGMVIQKDITPENLELFLNDHLASR
jgi:peroxiredoxin